MNLLFKDDEIIAYSPPAQASAGAEATFPEMFPELSVAASPQASSLPSTDPDSEEYYDEAEAEPSASHASFAPEEEAEPVPAPAPAPAPARERPRIEDFINSPPPVIHKSPSSSPLAAVVGRAPSPAAEATPPPQAAQAPAPQPAAPAVKKQAVEQQIDLGFSDQDRGRFKDTEPSIASGGEDLDVPTWMRLKRKLKR